MLADTRELRTFSISSIVEMQNRQLSDGKARAPS